MRLGVPHIRAMAIHLAWDSRQLAVAVQAAFLRTTRCLLSQRDWRACALVSAALVSAGGLHVSGTWASGSQSQRGCLLDTVISRSAWHPSDQ